MQTLKDSVFLFFFFGGGGIRELSCFNDKKYTFQSFYGDNWYRYPFLQQASYEARTAFNKIDNVCFEN